MPSAFFLSFIAPHQPISKTRLAGWVKEMLQWSDIDTSIFQAHSLKGAASSKALLKGLSVKEVLDQGNWSRESTWQKYYHRQVDSRPKKFQEGALKEGLGTRRCAYISRTIIYSRIIKSLSEIKLEILLRL